MWEDRTRKQGENIIQSEPHPREKGCNSTINVITRGRIRTGSDKYVLAQELIQKAGPSAFKFDLIKHNEFFKDVEMFIQIPNSLRDKDLRCQ